MPRCKKNNSARANDLAKARSQLVKAQSSDEPESSATPEHAITNGVNTSTDPVPRSRSPSSCNHSPVGSIDEVS